jgi:hypothetical protein
MQIRRSAVRITFRQPTFATTLALAGVLLCSTRTLAQQPAPTLQQDLQRIAAEASALQQSLPSFTCDEAATSQAIRDRKVFRSVHVEGNLRMVRQPDGRLKETYEFKRNRFLFVIPTSLPAYISGGFDSALSYFLPGAQGCYRYMLSSPRRIDFATRDDAATPAACKDRGLKGFALLNADGRVTHIERTIPADVAKPLKLATYASIDLAPVELDGRTFNLSNHLIAEMPIVMGATGRMEATYTHCHLFTTTVTIGPSSEVPAGVTTNPQ